jgi:hypothetical protein
MSLRPQGTRWATVVLLTLAVQMCSQRALAQFTDDQVHNFEKSVVRVIATKCQGSSPQELLAGSGFLWKHNLWVVSALHVVNGCQELSVQSLAAGTVTDAKVTKILLKDDLVLLTIEKALKGTAALSSVSDPPHDTQEMMLVGFPEDSSGLTAKLVRRQFGGTTLRDIVSSSAADELFHSGSPNLSTQVTFLQGMLEHGHSGAPIFNKNGQLVAIADGGLKHGPSEDSWAMPAAYLSDLESSTDPIAKMSAQKSKLLFSASKISGMAATVTCGQGGFKHLKTVKYDDLLATSDDPAGLKQLVQASAVDATTFSFEVYQDLQSGATVVIPEGETLSVNGGICVASNANQSVTIRARVQQAVANDDQYGNQASLAFETQVMQLTVPGWIYDPNFSYPTPIPVLGGGISRRKDWVHYAPVGPGMPPWYDAQQFETLAFRNRILLGVGVLNTRWTPNVVSVQQACRFNPQSSPFCQEALKDIMDWVQATLAVHLSTLAGR